MRSWVLRLVGERPTFVYAYLANNRPAGIFPHKAEISPHKSRGAQKESSHQESHDRLRIRVRQPTYLLSDTLCTHVDSRVKLAKTLYDNGCDTIAKLYLKEYQETLSPGTKRSLKYLKHSQCPVPKEYAEQIVVRCRSSHIPG